MRLKSKQQAEPEPKVEKRNLVKYKPPIKIERHADKQKALEKDRAERRSVDKRFQKPVSTESLARQVNAASPRKVPALLRPKEAPTLGQDVEEAARRRLGERLKGLRPQSHNRGRKSNLGKYMDQVAANAAASEEEDYEDDEDYDEDEDSSDAVPQSRSVQVDLTPRKAKRKRVHDEDEDEDDEGEPRQLSKAELKEKYKEEVKDDLLRQYGLNQQKPRYDEPKNEEEAADLKREFAVTQLPPRASNKRLLEGPEGSTLTKKRLQSLRTMFGQRSNDIIELLESEETDSAMMLAKKTLLQTLTDVLPAIEHAVRKSNGRFGVLQFNQTISQIREMLNDIQASRDRAGLGTKLVEVNVRPAFLDIGVQLRVAFANIELAAQTRMTPEEFKSFRDQVTLVNLQSLATFLEQTYRNVNNAMVSSLG